MRKRVGLIIACSLVVILIAGCTNASGNLNTRTQTVSPVASSPSATPGGPSQPDIHLHPYPPHLTQYLIPLHQLVQSCVLAIWGILLLAIGMPQRLSIQRCGSPARL